MTLSLFDVASYLPENRVPASYFEQYAGEDGLSGNAMFNAPAYRHHAAAGETNVDMMCAAIAELTARHGDSVLEGVDLVISHSQLPDLPVVGCGGDVAKRLGIAPPFVLDIHNGGCAALILMLRITEGLFATGAASKALLLNATNAAGNIFTQTRVRSLSQAAIPGDGASAVLVSSDGPTEVVEAATYQHSEYAGDMTASVEPHRRYWEPGDGQLHVGFTESKIAKVLARGNRQVPQAALDVAGRHGMRGPDIGHLVTNQPNRIFLRNWREALELPQERHPDTFDECGNLFAVGVPHTLDTAITEGRIAAGDTVMLAAFAHAGDFSAAALLRFGGRP
ncbi:3-oxoacyl-[acyl-carrier-protein] synthase III C-terminal domain-containing protein [Tsukamurella sp. 8F]|uniref:3-oxoacyl-ACP synthase III family protein n=1 Tax=unclassified Tsukamurella TaxID=2633480 RepID=UPI0023B8F8F7|nr:MULTISPECIES: 3-oxoacyl-[acyl-carrier-protein] synthase III C-terminal domain-containing protein [unclassified Tsukamurella]MDF0529524.1 3-oxoacyl-[acyl-carrier-protein] synthase III C-terminal domain-containing protein [Tsukamurella sp. 8J]MDF0585788.1 3-oxoacyl-[acyl-carrier-protein] synthase III C-terminal domain-containing protein [Tsukamurella sp. 8F]